VYIDPPYNTGKEDWVYNDNVNDPRILKWLGEVVGKEGEDLSRHDKWLCMMYPRLQLIQKLLSAKGKLAISISYHELDLLLLICKHIFSNKQVVPITVQTSGGKPSAGFNYLHEYIVFIVPNDFEPQSLEIFGGRSRSPFEGMTLSTFDKTNRPNQVYPIFIDNESYMIKGVGKSLKELVQDGEYLGELSDYEFEANCPFDNCSIVWPITSKGKPCCWRLEPKRLMSDWEKGYIKIAANSHKDCPNDFSVHYLPEGVINKILAGTLEIIGKEANGITLKFGDNTTEGSSVPTIWSEKSFYTVKGTNLLGDIFNAKVFDYPKALDLITTILDAITSKNDTVLDSFAGSGTTAHAVLRLNEKDEGSRNFILIEMMDYAETATAERVKRVISGYPTKQKHEEELYSKKLTIANLKNATTFLAEANTVIEQNKDKYAEISKPKIQDNCIKVIASTVTDGKVAGIDAAFDFYEIGEPIFTDDGYLNESVGVERMREYIFYADTHQSLPTNSDSYLMGNYQDAAYYFYYKQDAMTELNIDTLSELIVAKADHYVIYADSCTLSAEFMAKYNITFKKIPRDIRRF
jgi:adenine-specific DNA-methyltransferase